MFHFMVSVHTKMVLLLSILFTFLMRSFCAFFSVPAFSYWRILWLSAISFHSIEVALHKVLQTGNPKNLMWPHSPKSVAKLCADSVHNGNLHIPSTEE